MHGGLACADDTPTWACLHRRQGMVAPPARTCEHRGVPEDGGQLAALAVVVLLAAALYSSVGHGGASAYLAAMALFAVPPAVMKPAALAMNVLVASVGVVRFGAGRLVPWSLLLPLALGSVPAAMLGGAIELPSQLYRPLLGALLLFAAARLVAPAPASVRRPPPGAAALIVLGVALGLLAGATGIGGGIFLSPLLILRGWEEPRRTAGAASVFILVNSLAGLAGHLQAGRTIPPATAPLALVVLAGGLYGSWLGARRLPPLALRRVLAVVLVTAGGKLLVEAAWR